MATLRCGHEDVPLELDNDFLAHLQVALQKRFMRGGGGFFLTGTQRTGDTERTVSRWLHPHAELEFVYDVLDGSGNRLPPVRLDDDKIDTIFEAMDRPVGVRANGDVWLSFTE